MPKIINQDFPTQFPMDRYAALSGLGERGLMSPTSLSTLLMFVILPAQFIVEKKKPLVNDEQGFCTADSWFNRANLAKFPFSQFKNRFYNEMVKTHTFTSFSVDGLETLEAKQKQQTSNAHYEIFYAGNGQDAMHFYYTAFVSINKDAHRNYIFWNYPGVGSSVGSVHSVQDLFKTGYKQAKRLLDQGIPAQHITLRGLSLGGGIAVHVARQLHEEGHLVNLEIDRSFSFIGAVLPAIFKRDMLDSRTSKPSGYAPLLSSISALALSGIALGTTFAGFVASVGLVAASAVAAIGYIAALCIQALGFLLQKIMITIGEMIAIPFSFFAKSISNDIKVLFNNIGYCFAYPFKLAAFAINKIFSILASMIDITVNLLSSVAGAGIAIGGLGAGIFAGLVFGALLSIQLLWTEQPLTMPMTPAFSAALYSACCEMDSVSAMQRLLKTDNTPENCAKEPPQISVINTMDDEVIAVAASLNSGLGLKPGQQSSDDEPRPLTAQINSFWYRRGGHCGELESPMQSSPSF